MYHLEERSVSTAIRYEKCAQIFFLSANKNLSDTQFVTLQTAIRYNVNMVLTSSKQRVKIGSSCSLWNEIKRGVPC